MEDFIKLVAFIVTVLSISIIVYLLVLSYTCDGYGKAMSLETKTAGGNCYVKDAGAKWRVLNPKTMTIVKD